MQAYISNCLLGSKKRSNNFQFKSSLASKYIFLENQNSLITPLAVCASLLKERQPKGPDEERNSQWWENGYRQWTEEQFKKRLHVTRETFEFILETVTDDIAKETTKFKEPTSPQCQLALTLYRLAHGCSYTTVGDLFGVAPSTACTIFNHVIRCIVQALYDDYMVLPRNEEEWKNEINAFLENWEFPCVGAWDGFHVYISCNLKNFFSFKKRYSVTNMGFIGANKRFLWAGVGAPGSVHDSTLLQSSDIFRSIESGHCLPNQVLRLPGYGEIPFTTVGDSAFPPRAWLLKAYPDTTRCPKQKNFNNKLRSARVVSEHAYGMLKGRWRILYKKTECRRSNVKAIIMCCIALHNICIKTILVLLGGNSK